MTDDEFKAIVTEHKAYLKPALFTIIMGNAGVFSDETKKEILDQFIVADGRMKELSDYQEKRNSITKKWLGKFEEFYRNLKAKFNQAAENERAADKSQADQLLSNL